MGYSALKETYPKNQVNCLFSFSTITLCIAGGGDWKKSLPLKIKLSGVDLSSVHCKCQFKYGKREKYEPTHVRS